MHNTDLILLTYKLATLLSGVFLCYLGYRLFMKGVFNQAGDVSLVFKDNKILLKRAAPGTFFVVFGAAIICWAIYSGYSFMNQTIKSQPAAIEQSTPKPTFN